MRFRSAHLALSRSVLLAAALTALPMTVLAHDTMPANWCSGSNETPVIISTFSFTPEQLQATAEQVEQILGPEGLIAEGLAERMPDGRCGIVDRWRMATYIAQNHCPSASGNPNAIINITGPTSYTSSGHHEEYVYGAGLQGSCAVCASPTTPLLGP